MSQKHYLIDMAEARAYIDANFPNDPLLRRVAANLIEKIPKADYGWIPVTEDLPPKHPERYDEPDGSTIQYEASEEVAGLSRNNTVHIVVYEEGASFRGWYDDYGIVHDITHWLPLPGLPEKEDEK